MALLSSLTLVVHQGLNGTAEALTRLVTAMKLEAGWDGAHKAEILAWMDLLRQYNDLLAADAIGQAAVDALDAFCTHLDTYYVNSELYRTLATIAPE
jgi:hypothetical protein